MTTVNADAISTIAPMCLDHSFVNRHPAENDPSAADVAMKQNSGRQANIPTI